MILEKNSINTGQYFCLRSFACLKVAGKDAKVFLQNLIANDIEHLDLFILFFSRIKICFKKYRMDVKQLDFF